jgi:hypothetical protein
MTARVTRTNDPGSFWHVAGTTHVPWQAASTARGRSSYRLTWGEAASSGGRTRTCNTQLQRLARRVQ